MFFRERKSSKEKRVYVYVCARVSVSERNEECGGCLCACGCVYLRACVCVKEREGEKKRVCSRRMGELCNKASRVFIDPCPMAFLLSHYCNNDLTDGPETFSKKRFSKLKQSSDPGFESRKVRQIFLL